MNSAGNPASGTEHINLYYKILDTKIAAELNLDPDDIAQAFSSTTAYQIAEDASEAATNEDINSLAEMGSGSVAAQDLVREFLSDITPSDISKDAVFDFVNLYRELVLVDNDLSSDDKEQLLYSLSVFYYSYSFWSSNL